VLDKDLTAALLGRTVDADVLVIATDVEAAVLDWATPQARPVGRVTPEQMRQHAADGHFAGGSMGPKVEAVVRFVESGGSRAVITSLERIADAVQGMEGAGTVITQHP
jgi:carbamate kinase